jgi:hypothetical protein
MKRPIDIEIIGRPSEIRIGSPYQTCELKLRGTDLKLPKNNWSDKFAWTKDNKFLTLIQRNFKDNDPGFHFYIIDTQADKLIKSDRILGLVNSMKIKNDKVLYNKFSLDREKSEHGKLCCNTDEEYEFEK